MDAVPGGQLRLHVPLPARRPQGGRLHRPQRLSARAEAVRAGLRHRPPPRHRPPGRTDDGRPRRPAARRPVPVLADRRLPRQRERLRADLPAELGLRATASAPCPAGRRRGADPGLLHRRLPGHARQRPVPPRSLTAAAGARGRAALVRLQPRRAASRRLAAGDAALDPRRGRRIAAGEHRTAEGGPRQAGLHQAPAGGRRLARGGPRAIPGELGEPGEVLATQDPGARGGHGVRRLRRLAQGRRDAGRAPLHRRAGRLAVWPRPRPARG